MCSDILCRFGDAITRKYPENEETKVGLSFTTMPNTPVGYGQGFLSKEQSDSTRVSPIIF